MIILMKYYIRTHRSVCVCLSVQLRIDLAVSVVTLTSDLPSLIRPARVQEDILEDSDNGCCLLGSQMDAPPGKTTLT